MKRTINAIAGIIFSLLSTNAFAGVFTDNQETIGRQQLAANSTSAVEPNTNCESKGVHLPPADQIAHMKLCLAQASSPANVKAVALHKKKASCDRNAKNKALIENEKERYLATCLSHNEAQVQYALITRETKNRRTIAANEQSASNLGHATNK